MEPIVLGAICIKKLPLLRDYNVQKEVNLSLFCYTFRRATGRLALINKRAFPT